MDMQTQKQWEVYKAKSAALARIQRDVRNQFEDANLFGWRERLASCKSLVAVSKLMVEFELADAR